jgi:hypothetical protein
MIAATVGTASEVRVPRGEFAGRLFDMRATWNGKVIADSRETREVDG